MALTPQIDNQMSNNVDTTTIPSKTYKLSTDLVTSLIEGEVQDVEEYIGTDLTILNKDKVKELNLLGNSEIKVPIARRRNRKYRYFS